MRPSRLAHGRLHRRHIGRGIREGEAVAAIPAADEQVHLTTKGVQRSPRVQLEPPRLPLPPAPPQRRFRQLEQPTGGARGDRAAPAVVALPHARQARRQRQRAEPGGRREIRNRLRVRCRGLRGKVAGGGRRKRRLGLGGGHKGLRRLKGREVGPRTRQRRRGLVGESHRLHKRAVRLPLLYGAGGARRVPRLVQHVERDALLALGLRDDSMQHTPPLRRHHVRLPPGVGTRLGVRVLVLGAVCRGGRLRLGRTGCLQVHGAVVRTGEVGAGAEGGVAIQCGRREGARHQAVARKVRFGHRIRRRAVVGQIAPRLARVGAHLARVTKVHERERRGAAVAAVPSRLLEIVLQEQRAARRRCEPGRRAVPPLRRLEGTERWEGAMGRVVTDGGLAEDGRDRGALVGAAGGLGRRRRQKGRDRPQPRLQLGQRLARRALGRVGTALDTGSGAREVGRYKGGVGRVHIGRALRRGGRGGAAQSRRRCRRAATVDARGDGAVVGGGGAAERSLHGGHRVHVAVALAVEVDGVDVVRARREGRRAAAARRGPVNIGHVRRRRRRRRDARIEVGDQRRRGAIGVRARGSAVADQDDLDTRRRRGSQRIHHARHARRQLRRAHAAALRVQEVVASDRDDGVRVAGAMCGREGVGHAARRAAARRAAASACPLERGAAGNAAIHDRRAGAKGGERLRRQFRPAVANLDDRGWRLRVRGWQGGGQEEEEEEEAWHSTSRQRGGGGGGPPPPAGRCGRQQALH